MSDADYSARGMPQPPGPATRAPRAPDLGDVIRREARARESTRPAGTKGKSDRAPRARPMLRTGATNERGER